MKVKILGTDQVVDIAVNDCEKGDVIFVVTGMLIVNLPEEGLAEAIPAGHRIFGFHVAQLFVTGENEDDKKSELD